MTMPVMPALPDLAVANLSASLDPGNLDQRLQAVSGVTSMWQFPDLPDTVKLDLAMYQDLPDPQSLTDFTNGIGFDLDQAQKPQPVALPPSPTQTQLSALYFPEDDPVTRVRQMFSAVAGKPAPSLVSDQAVVKIKQRALAAGLITPDSALDGSWSPAMNGVKYQLAQDDFKNRLQGERTGAMKTNKMIGILDKWTSPTGLLSAATALGFVPDVEKVKSETKNWGKKIGDWWNNDRSNPLKMVQALSGPIDDIMFPVVNDVLLLSGVGNVVTFSRFAMASKALKGADAIGDLATAGRFITMGGDIVSDSSRASRLFGLAIKESNAAAEIGRTRQAGMISTRLGNSSKAIPNALGKGMAAWRNTTSTVIAKKAVQQGMKLGLVSNLEHGFQGEEVNARFDFRSWAYGEHSNPLTQGMASFGEIALTPTTILNRGAFTNPVKDGASLLRRKLTQLPADQRLGTTFFKAAQEHVRYADPAKFASMQQAMKGIKDGRTAQQAGLMHLLGADTAEEAGMRMYGVVMTKALDKWAKLKTLESGLSPTENPDEWRQVFHVMRNKATAQLRDLSDVAGDIDNPRHRTMFAAMRSHVAAADNVGADVESVRAQAFRDVLAGLDTPEGKTTAMAELANHAATRRGTWNEVLGTLDEADIAEGIGEHWDDLSRWHEYTVALDKVRTIDPSQVSIASLSSDFEDSWRMSALGEEMLGAKPGVDVDNAWVNDLSVQLDEGRGRVALAKITTKTRQDAELFEAHVASLIEQLPKADAATTKSIKKRLADLNNSPVWDEFKVEAEHTSIESKLARLRETKRWIAKDVTVPNDLAQELQGMGYKPVFGVEYAFPHDVMDLMGPMPYIAQSTMRKHSLGLFFGRDNQSQDLLQGLRSERFKNIARAEMSRVHGKDLDPDELLTVLRRGRHAIDDAAAKDSLHAETMGSFTGRIGSRVKNAAVLPFSVYRLDEKQVAGILGDGYSKSEIKTIVASLRKAENVGFNYQGLQKFESELVANSWTRGALKAFGPSAAADGLGPIERLKQEPGSWRQWRKSLGQIAGAAGTSPGLAKRVGASAALGTVGATQSDDSLLAGGGGALAGAAFPRILSPKIMARLVLAQGARMGAEDMGASGLEKNLLGLAAPLGAMPIAAKILSNPAWGQYSRLADKGRYLRDLYRFSLSPVWDIQRYTEGAVMNLTSDLGVVNGKRVVLPVTTRPMKRAMQDTGMAKDEIVNQFKRYSGDFYNVDAIESTERRLHDVGIMGYHPTEWMASAHAQMMKQGLTGEDAFEKVINIYTYGTTGRSAAELSFNFVFFPFSFQKKYLGNMAKFLSQDMGRTVMLHDSMKMWSDLYEHYDLDTMLQDHVPMMQQMRKINALAFGISPGEFGGINRPIYELAHRMPVVNEVHDAIVNSFLPQAVKIDTQSGGLPGTEGWREVENHVKRMLPVWRDVEDMHNDLTEQRNVLTSPTHQVAAKAAEQGWEEWRKVNEEINTYATALGTTYGSIMANEDYGFIKQQIERKRALVMQKYPEFVESRQRAAEKAIAKQDEIKKMTANPTGPDEVAMKGFIAYVDQYKDVMALSGINMTNDIEAVPPFVFDALRRRAISLGQESPGFNRLYRIYYSGMFGPIEYQVVR